jgi:hypothetical protein
MSFFRQSIIFRPRPKNIFRPLRCQAMNNVQQSTTINTLATLRFDEEVFDSLDFFKITYYESNITVTTERKFLRVFLLQTTKK